MLKIQKKIVFTYLLVPSVSVYQAPIIIKCKEMQRPSVEKENGTLKGLRIARWLQEMMSR